MKIGWEYVAMVGVLLGSGFFSGVPFFSLRWILVLSVFIQIPTVRAAGEIPWPELSLSEVNLCVHSLCGDPKVRPSLSKLPQGFLTESVTFQQNWNQLIEPGLRARLIVDQKNQKDLSDRFRDELKSLPRLTELSLPDKLKLHQNPWFQTVHLLVWSQQLARMESLIDEAEDGSPTLDLEVLEEEFPQAEERLVVRAIFESLLVPRWKRGDAKDAEELEKRLPVIRAYFAKHHQEETLDLFVTKEDAELLMKARSKQNLSIYEKNEYRQLAERIELLHLVSGQSVSESEISPSNEALIHRALHRVDVFLKRVRYYQNNLPDPDFAPEVVLKSCRARLQQLESTVASGLRSNALLKQIEELKQRALQVLVKEDPALDPAKLAQFLAGVQVSMPQTDVSDFWNTLRAAARRKTRLPEGPLLWFQLIQYLQESSSLAMHARMHAVRPDRLSGTAAGVCEFLGLGAPADAADTEAQKIFVSWFSVLFPEQGIGIVAHELGHLVHEHLSHLGNHQSLDAKVECLKTRNAFEQDREFASEDWADDFAAKVIKAKGQANFACALLPADIENADSRVGYLIPRSGSHHSPTIYRLLNVAEVMESMTPACQSLKEKLILAPVCS